LRRSGATLFILTWGKVSAAGMIERGVVVAAVPDDDIGFGLAEDLGENR